MSYNILADNLLFKNKYLYDKHALPDHLMWQPRWKRILDHILKTLPSIICLQEVHCTHIHRDIGPALSAQGYSCTFYVALLSLDFYFILLIIIIGYGGVGGWWFGGGAIKLLIIQI
jgi:hypothetical protein